MENPIQDDQLASRVSYLEAAENLKIQNSYEVEELEHFRKVGSLSHVSFTC